MVKGKTVILSLALVVIVPVLFGCTGNSFGSDNQQTLNDLYMAATGTMVHAQAGQFVADTAKANGAYAAGIALRIPYSRLVADVWAKYSTPSGEFFRLWEIKPDHYHFIDGKLEDASAQLTRYVDKMKAAGYDVRPWYPSGVNFPPPGTPVPDEYTPQAANRCLQVIITTRSFNDYPNSEGVIGYRYRWHPTRQVNGVRCKNQDHATKNAFLAGFAADAADWVKENHGLSQGQYMLAVTAKKTDLAAIRQQLVDVYTQNDADEWVVEMGTTKAKLHEVLMDKAVPALFRDISAVQVPFPGARGDTKDYWNCDEIAC